MRGDTARIAVIVPTISNGACHPPVGSLGAFKAFDVGRIGSHFDEFARSCEVNGIAPLALVGVVAVGPYARIIMCAAAKAFQQVVLVAVGHKVGHVLGEGRIGGYLHVPFGLAVVHQVPTQVGGIGGHLAHA